MKRQMIKDLGIEKASDRIKRKLKKRESSRSIRSDQADQGADQSS